MSDICSNPMIWNFFVMVIGLIAVVVYMWKTRRFRFLQELDAEAAAAGH